MDTFWEHLCQELAKESIARDGDVSLATQEMKGSAGEQASDMRSHAISVNKQLGRNMQEKLGGTSTREVRNI